MSLSPNTSCRSNMKTQIVNKSDEELSFLFENYTYYTPIKKDYKDMFTTSDISCSWRTRPNTKFDLKNDYCGKFTNHDFDNITKTLENLHVNDDNKNVSSKNNLDKIKCRDKLLASPSENKEDVNNNDNVTIKNYCKRNICLSFNIREEEQRCLPPNNLNSSDEEIEQKDEDSYDSDDSYDDSDLIEKGPIKPEYQHQRAGPYFNCQLRNSSVVIPTDYERTAEQIMRNKDYSDKLNPCLDQLSSMNCQNQLLIKAILPDRVEENGDFRSGDPSGDKLSSIFVNEMEDEALINFMKKTGYQSAQTMSLDNGNHSISSPRSTLSDSPRSYISYVSRSNSRASSRAQSPGSATNSSGSPQMPLNIIGSPLGSPQITPAYRVPQALLSSSSSNQSSASNQSYSDVSSPLNYQTPQNYQFANFSDILCNGDSSRTINETDELQLIEEVIKEEGERAELLTKSQVTSNIPHFSPSYNKLEHEYPASNTQNKSIYSVHEIPIDNFRTDYTNMLNVNSDKELDSPNYCMLNKCVPSNLYPNQTCYDTSIKNPQVDVARYTTFPNIVLNDNGGSVKMSEQNSSQKMSQATFNEKNQASSSIFAPTNFQTPTTVPSLSASNRHRRKPAILPWRMLKLPSVSASERLKEVLDPKEVAKAMYSLAMVPIERLTTTDKDGDTQLMHLLSDTEEFAKNKAFLVPLIERLDNTPSALEMKNKNGENALFIAALNYPEMSYICGYLAAVMLHKGIDINQKLDKYGNTLIHCIAAQGDSHGEVLAEMLKLLKGNSTFDISCRNIYGQTALHIAVKEHLIGSNNIKALATTRLLLENGADLKVKEIRSGDTALHMAVSLHHDPELVKVLLLNADSMVVNERNYKGNTPLHIAAGFSTAVDLEKQKNICRLLIGAGALANIQNNEGKTPLALVSLERKEIIKKILHKKL